MNGIQSLEIIGVGSHRNAVDFLIFSYSRIKPYRLKPDEFWKHKSATRRKIELQELAPGGRIALSDEQSRQGCSRKAR